jgi:hypothetical protein
VVVEYECPHCGRTESKDSSKDAPTHKCLLQERKTIKMVRKDDKKNSSAHRNT